MRSAGKPALLFCTREVFEELGPRWSGRAIWVALPDALRLPAQRWDSADSRPRSRSECHVERPIDRYRYSCDLPPIHAADGLVQRTHGGTGGGPVGVAEGRQPFRPGSLAVGKRDKGLMYRAAGKWIKRCRGKMVLAGPVVQAAVRSRCKAYHQVITCRRRQSMDWKRCFS